MKTLFTVIIILLLSACQTMQKINTQSSDSDKKPDHVLFLKLTADGWQSPAGRIVSDQTPISIDWDGDAIELLEQLAHQRGLVLRYSGIRLPLPVTIHESGATYNTVLRLICSQIDWRATLSQRYDALEVNFMPHIKSESKKG